METLESISLSLFPRGHLAQNFPRPPNSIWGSRRMPRFSDQKHHIIKNGSHGTDNLSIVALVESCKVDIDDADVIFQHDN